jgi:hypothetical protein
MKRTIPKGSQDIYSEPAAKRNKGLNFAGWNLPRQPTKIIFDNHKIESRNNWGKNYLKINSKSHKKQSQINL